MTLNLPLLYFVWTEEYCQTSPNKNKSSNHWHLTSILVSCIFACTPVRTMGHLHLPSPSSFPRTTAKLIKRLHSRCNKSLFCFQNYRFLSNVIALHRGATVFLWIFLRYNPPVIARKSGTKYHVLFFNLFDRVTSHIFVST